jgi:hypothetical protein
VNGDPYEVVSAVSVLTGDEVWAAIDDDDGDEYRYVEVVNMDGAASVTYAVGRTDPTDPTSEGANLWVLPASAGASRAHELDVRKGLHVDVVSAGTPKVLVTAW